MDFLYLKKGSKSYDGITAAGVINLIIIAASVSDVFFTIRNLSNICRQIVTNGLNSLGMLAVVLTGGIDLSE